MFERVFYASSAAATKRATDEGSLVHFTRPNELGRILWVTFLGRARKVTRLSVREPTLFNSP